MNHIVGISEMMVSNNVEDTLITYSLGSCLGLAIYDPVVKVGGLIHCMLPLSKIDPRKAITVPCMFVDTGVPLLFNEVYKLGGKKNRLLVKVAGCAKVFDDNGMFNIGERNYITLRKLLWKNDVLITAEDVGGTASRTMSLEILTGKVLIKYGDMRIEL